MATFSVSGNVQAVNARIQLRPTNWVDGIAPVFTYSDSLGNYSFSGVAPGNYQVAADNTEVTVTYTPALYSFRNRQGVTINANNITNVNFTPVLLNAVNPSVNAF